MNFQYICDEQGRKSHIVVPVKEWERRERLLVSKEKTKVIKAGTMRSKKEILDGISSAVNEVKLIRAGKLKPKTFKAVLNEI